MHKNILTTRVHVSVYLPIELRVKKIKKRNKRKQRMKYHQW